MDTDSLSPRALSMIGLLALLPLAWYAVARSPMAAGVAAVNVAIIVGSLLVAMRPLAGHEEGETGHAAP